MLSSARTFFTAAIVASRCSSVPCEKLIRKTSTPCWASARIISSEFVAGPSVATILVRLTCILLGMYSSMVEVQAVYLHYIIVQHGLEQMQRAPNERPGPGTGVSHGT